MDTLAVELVARGERAISRPRRATALLPPPGVWRWWETASVALLVTLLLAAAATLDASGLEEAAAVRRVALTGSMLALGACVLLYVHWRLAGGGALAGLILALSAMSVHLATMAGLAAVDPERTAERPGMILVTRLVLTATVLVLAVLLTRGLRVDPLVAGFGLGAALFVGRYVVLMLVPHLNLPERDLNRLALTVLLLDLCIATAVATYPRAPQWVRFRLAAALVFLAVAHTMTYPAPSPSWSGAAVAVVGQIAATTILLSLSICLVRLSIRDNRSAVGILREQLLRIEAVTRSEQARLHEIRATIAGIANAAELIDDHHAIAPARRAAMSQMMTAEISRLGRLACGSEDHPAVAVDVATTLEPLVTRLVGLGHRVHVPPISEVVLGHADDVAEIVNVLLENAVRHGQGSDVVVSCRRLGDEVEIAVSDAGPGVPPDLRDQIFDWGISGPLSNGDGIGLHIARELSTELGGHLELAPREGHGATFVLTLPAAPQDTGGDR